MISPALHQSGRSTVSSWTASALPIASSAFAHPGDERRFREEDVADAQDRFGIPVEHRMVTR